MDITEFFAYCEVLRMSPSEMVERIEVELFMKGLLSAPQKLRKIAEVKIETVMVDVAWHNNCFVASYDKKVPRAQRITAPTFQELQRMAKEYIETHDERLLNMGEPVPTWLLYKRYEFSYHFLDVTALLKAYKPMLTLAAISRATGISQSLLSQYATGKQKALPRQLQRIVGGIHRMAKELMMVVS